MMRKLLTSIAVLVASPDVFAQSDEQLIENLRSSAAATFLAQASWTLPDSFHNSGLVKSEKDKIIRQLAADSADCLADSLVTYAVEADVPVSDLVSSDGVIEFKGNSGQKYSQLVEICIAKVWEAAGISRE